MQSAVRLQSGDWRVTAADGENFTFSEIDWEIALELNSVATVPALPGTYLVHYNDDADGPDFFRTNVLGWMLSLDNIVRPIVIDSELLTGGWTALHPDGRIETSGGETWNTAEEWVAAQKRSASA